VDDVKTSYQAFPAENLRGFLTYGDRQKRLALSLYSLDMKAQIVQQVLFLQRNGCECRKLENKHSIGFFSWNLSSPLSFIVFFLILFY